MVEKVVKTEKALQPIVRLEDPLLHSHIKLSD